MGKLSLVCMPGSFSFIEPVRKARKESNMTNYSKHIANRQRQQITPPSEPIPGTNQKPNNAGGYSFVVDKWTQLQRFLVLGAEGGTYYVSEQKLTRDNAKNVIHCIKEDGRRTVDLIVDISDKGRAPKNDAALFALALAASEGDALTKQYALAALPKVARIGTHLFGFAESIRSLRGWSKAVSRAFRNWYESKEDDQLAFQLIKYQQRNGWSHRDLLRLSHVKAGSEIKNSLYRWAVKGNEDSLPNTVPDNKGLQLVWAFERAKKEDEAGIIKLIQDYRLPWEAIPTEKRTAKVWEALLPTMGLTALFRNLGNLSSHEVIAPGRWENNQLVIDRLTNAEALKKGRIHPLQVLVALNTYARGAGIRGTKSWNVVGDIKDALDAAFYSSFDAVTPANKRFLLGLDVSGSMSGPELASLPGITPRIGAAAMSMITYRTEPQCLVMAFAHDFRKIDLSKKDTLESVITKTSALDFGGTNCALPMIYASRNNIAVDAFVVYTDSETWHGDIHPVQALRQYRDKTGIPARLIVVGMTATKFTIGDPSDNGMLDVVGFDTSAPQIMRDFVAGEI